MHEELKRNNSIGNLKGIMLFEANLFDKKLTSIDAFKDINKFELGAQINSALAVHFFEYLGIITFSNKRIALTPQGMALADKDKSERNLAIGQIIMDKLLEENLIDINSIHVDSLTGVLYITLNAFVLSAAIFRNFLISVKYLIPMHNHLQVNAIVEDKIKTGISKKHRIISQEELLNRIKREQEDGALAEKIVLKYEQKRLNSKRHAVKQISQLDVTAGYDILSFNSDDSDAYDRYIEVKSFHGREHFYWSLNEKNVAELLGDNYYIYLINLDLYTIQSDDVQPIIIKNPSKNINNNDWAIEATNFVAYRILLKE